MNSEVLEMNSEDQARQSQLRGALCVHAATHYWSYNDRDCYPDSKHDGVDHLETCVLRPILRTCSFYTELLYLPEHNKTK